MRVKVKRPISYRMSELFLMAQIGWFTHRTHEQARNRLPLAQAKTADETQTLGLVTTTEHQTRAPRLELCVISGLLFPLLGQRVLHEDDSEVDRFEGNEHAQCNAAPLEI